MPHPRLTALAIAGLATGLVLSAPTAALAATHSPTHGAPRGAGHRPAPHKPAPKPAAKSVHFAGDGIIVGRTPAGTQLLVRDLHLGRKDLRNQVVTLKAKPTPVRHRPIVAADTAALPVGDMAQVSGDSNGSVDDLEVVNEVVKPAPAELFLGVVRAVSANTLTVADQRAVDSTDDAEQHQLTVDTSQAAVAVDGAAGALGAGQYVAILGERDHDTVLAASITAYSTAPDIQAGAVNSINGNTVALATGDDQQEGDNTTAQPATGIDLTGVPLVLDGTAGASAAQLTIGDKLLMLGATSNGVFTPTSAYAFTQHDTKPAGDNQD